MSKTGFVYFMSNAYNNTLYVGVTNDLVRRVAEHKAKINKGFTYKYNCDKLVYFEEFDLIADAIAREKQLKNWKREWKNDLIVTKNPNWEDLCHSIGVDEEMIIRVKEHYRGIAGQARNDDEKEGVADQVRNDALIKGQEHDEGVAGQARNDATKII